MKTAQGIGVVLAAALVVFACRAEDPARAALRQRLLQPAQLSADELARVREEVRKAIEGKTVRVKDGATTRPLTPEERTVVLGMLTEPAGLFDEGLRQEPGGAVRVLNAPGLSDDPEIEATSRLWIDVNTFLPRRFLFNYAVPGRGDYAWDLDVES
jgi:hypothetical protein